MDVSGRTARGLLIAACLTVAALSAVLVYNGDGSRDARAQAALQGDVVFIIDESGSMGDDIAAVQANVGTIATGFTSAGIDAQFALVGFGTDDDAAGHGLEATDGSPHTHTNLTDQAGLSAALGNLVADGSNEPGVDATRHAMNNVTGYRTDAAACAILITDEDADDVGAGDLAAANADLDARNATWFGIVDLDEGNTATIYGPSAGSMSAHTGGAVFEIDVFRGDPQPVLSTVVAACAAAIVSQGETPVDVKPESCPNPLNIEEHGIVPVAVLGTTSFDAAQIDPSTVSLEGVSPLRWSLEDVATPFAGPLSDPPSRFDCTTSGPDGLSDLTLKFDAASVASAIDTNHGPLSDDQVVVATLTGVLFDGTPFSGQDVIWIVSN